jgi:hypothetical protein
VIENVVVNTISTNEVARAWYLKVSPNPGTGRFVVSIADLPTRPEALRADVFDNSGRLVYQTQWLNSGNSLTEILDLERLPAGRYTLRLQQGPGVAAISLYITR